MKGPLPETALLMDASTAYCEKHKVFQLFEGLMARLIVEKPDDPISFLINALQTDVRPRAILTSVDSELVSTHAELLASTHGLVLVDAEAVFANVASSGVSDEAKTYLDNGEAVPNEILVQALTEKLLTEECVSKGWVLTAFPKAVDQAQLFLAMGNLPTVFLDIDVPDSHVIDRISGRRFDPENAAAGPVYHVTRRRPSDSAILARLRQRPEDSEESVTERIRGHRRTHRHIAPLFESITYTVDGTQDKTTVAARLDALLHAPAPSRAPRPAPAVALIGPPGSGTAGQAARLAAKFGIVLVSAEELVEAAVLHGTSVGLKAKVYRETDTPVPDELMCSLVIDRLAQEDCRRHGWVLEGFPRTSSQAVYLGDHGVAVRDVVVLDLGDEPAMSALTGRRIDPVDGKVYHISRLPADLAAEVKDRLLQHPRDTKEVVERRLAAWNTGKASVIAHYGEAAHFIDASVDEEELFERLSPFVLRMDERHLV